MTDITKLMYYENGRNRLSKTSDRFIFLNEQLGFEGSTANDYETVISVTDPTADRTITLPNSTGTTVLRSSSTSLTAGQFLIASASDTNIIESSSLLTIDTSSNFVGINQSSPEVTLHITGEADDKAQIRLEQNNDGNDAPDIRSKKSRGTNTSPTNNLAGDYLFRLNVESRESGSYQLKGGLQFDTSSTDVSKCKMQIKTHDGTSYATRLGVDKDGKFFINNGSKVITFPSERGSANQVLQTNGSGVLSFSSSLPITHLDIDGASSSVESLASTDLFIVDDGASGANKKLQAIKIPKYVYSEMNGDATATSAGAVTLAAASISGKTAITSAADTDTLLIHDATDDTLKKITKAHLFTGVGGISSVSEDTDPVLGGDLDPNGNDIIDTGNDFTVGTTGGNLILKTDGSQDHIFLTPLGTNSYVGIGPSFSANSDEPSYTLSVKDSRASYLAYLWNEDTTTSADGLVIRLDASATSTGNRFLQLNQGLSPICTITGDGSSGIIKNVLSGSYKLDVSGDITLDAAGGQVYIGQNGANYIQIDTDSTPRIVTSNGSALEIQSSGANMELNAGGDITLSAVGDQIRLGDGTNNYFTFNVDSTPQLDVSGIFKLTSTSSMEFDSSSNITLDADGGQIYFKDSGSTYLTFNVNGSTDSIQANGALSLNTTTGSITLDSGDDIVLDADGGDIHFRDSGSTYFTFNVTSTPELDVTGDFIIDCTQDITLDADGGTIYFKDASTTFLQFQNSTSNTTLSPGSGKSLIFDSPKNIVLDVDGSSTSESEVIFKRNGGEEAAFDLYNGGSGYGNFKFGDDSTRSTSVTVSASDTNAPLYVYNDDRTNNVAYFHNGKNSSLSDGIKIKLGQHSSSPGSSNAFLVFSPNNSTTAVGSVTGNGSGGVSYSSSFTGSHISITSENNLSIGLIVEASGQIWNNNNSISTALPKTTISNTNNSKKVYGVISSVDANQDKGFGGYIEMWGVSEGETPILVNSLGEGRVWVTNINGNIENGDYVTTSEISGHGRLQDDDLLHNYTVAKCTETVDWNSVNDTIDYNGVNYKKYLVACTYHCG